MEDLTYIGWRLRDFQRAQRLPEAAGGAELEI